MKIANCGSTLLMLALAVSPAAAAPQTLGKKAAAGDEERQDFHRKWISEDVYYIATAEEREVYSKLGTDQERDRFIEDFWRRRDPDPKTAANEFREEHYRRLAYANERFKAGRSGWRTDRGRVYIVYGPPTSVRSYPAGTLYNRPLSEGGGQTKTFPFEVWSYRSIPGLGSDVELEFVDSDLSGDYHLSLSPDEKDALLYVPGAGSTFLEQMGAQTRADRVNELGLLRPLDSSRPGFKRERSFDRLKRYFDVRNGAAAGGARFREEVDTRIQYDQFPFELRTDWFWAFGNSFLVPVTLEIANREVDFSPNPAGGGVQEAKVNIYGSVEDLSGRMIQEFERDLQVSANDIEQSQGRSVFQEILALESGRYKLTVVVRDPATGKIGSSERLLLVPVPPEGLFCSPPILARQISVAEDLDSDFGRPFVTPSGLKILPYPSQRLFSRKVGLYLELYGFQVDGASGLPDLDVQALVTDSDGRQVFQESLTASGAVRVHGERAAISKYLYLDTLPEGPLTLSVKITDAISQSQITASTPIQLPQTPRP